LWEKLCGQDFVENGVFAGEKKIRRWSVKMNEVIGWLVVQKSTMGDIWGGEELEVGRVEDKEGGDLGQLELSENDRR
jgi:hypothetical protein